MARFRAFPPELQRRIVLGGSLAGFIGFIILIALAVPEPPRLEQRKAVVRHLLTDADPRALGIDGLAADLRDLRKTEKETQQRIRTLEEKPKGTDATQTHDADLQGEIRVLKEEIESLKKERAGGIEPPPATPVDIFPPLTKQKPQKGTDLRDLDRLMKTPMTLNSDSKGVVNSSIRVIRAAKAEGVVNGTVTRATSADGIYIPAGSLIAGYLLNGLDAPTGTHARKEPFPVLVRVKEEAILPNRYRADLRECFLIASGYGDLSAERAYIRAEIFSCIRQDGGVIEVPMDAYAVGEDGKLGLRGRIIDKQGQLVAESLAAGFAQGFSSIFSRIQVPVLMTGGQGSLSPNVPFQSAFSQSAMEGATLQGTGSALNRLANYYMDMAENLFPVIEIDVTRRIEFVVQRGTELRLGRSDNTGR